MAKQYLSFIPVLLNAKDKLVLWKDLDERVKHRFLDIYFEINKIVPTEEKVEEVIQNFKNETFIELENGDYLLENAEKKEETKLYYIIDKNGQITGYHNQNVVPKKLLEQFIYENEEKTKEEKQDFTENSLMENKHNGINIFM
ncbi:hypothetical protein [Bacillus badius]|uniref:hypothetical protein n=1 Tax=Bacillus badius TaxID=1455 RepID=UPI0007B34457|nr:hypothetical protein [Bacillus badius]KZR59368.1 hypothetical protein A3781_13280 [Bacillus badius]